MNYRTIMCDMPTDIRGYVVEKEDFYTIIVNSRLNYVQNKKTLLHELDHIDCNDFDSDLDVGAIELLKHSK